MSQLKIELPCLEDSVLGPQANSRLHAFYLALSQDYEPEHNQI